MTPKRQPQANRLPALAWVILAVALALPAPSPAAPPAGGSGPASVAFFETRIRPVLVAQCYGCHSAAAQARKKLRGRLRVDTRAGLRAGGDSGPALVPGKPSESLLIQVLKYNGDVKMPPKGKLPDAVIADFEAWIKAGAADPRDETTATGRPSAASAVEKGRSFWAYRLPVRPPTPQVRGADWPVNDVDRFIRACLEAKGLPCAPDAPRPVLIRRLYFDLIGLPPTPAEVDAFVRDQDPLAYEKLVDRLLASPQFGERWGRHWLDVARYAESVTLRGFVFKEAWRYRDYVIDSFNRDVSFDRFVREQIAGDLLPASTPAERSRQLVATTYLMLGNTNLEEQDKNQLRMDVVDEQLDVIGKGLLAQTITCARCHDHKFDPIPQRDYYALAGILRNTKVLEHANVSKWIERPLPAKPEVEAAVHHYEAALATLQTKIKAAKAEAAPQAGATGTVAVLEAKLRKLRATAPRGPKAMAPAEEKTIEDAPIHVRGSVHSLGPVVPRGFLQVATYGHVPEFPKDQSGRVQLAGWIASPENPLTARVYVNRVWYWLFGAGLVRTVDNFGTTGERPSHPALLDWLAIRFVRDGWSTKKLVRLLVLSRTYRQASSAGARAVAADPENRWFGRANRRRLEAECLRDTLLTVSGQLRLTPGGPQFPPNLGSDYGFKQTATCRSVYLPVFRNALPELFEVFDFADPSMVTGRRGASTVAPQALFMMNSPFVIAQARQAAARLLAQALADDAARITQAYRLVLGREPTAGERALTARFLADRGRTPREAWTALFQTLFASADFRYVE